MSADVAEMFQALETMSGVVAPLDPYARAVARLAFATGQKDAARAILQAELDAMEAQLDKVHEAIALVESWSEVSRDLAITAEIAASASPWLSKSPALVEPFT